MGPNSVTSIFLHGLYNVRYGSSCESPLTAADGLLLFSVSHVLLSLSPLSLSPSISASLPGRYHPDKNKGNEEAKRMFNNIREANEILGDPDKKLLYDTGGMEAVKSAAKEDASGGAMDPFSAFFGGGGGRRGRNSKKGPDASVDMSVELRQLYTGAEAAAHIQRRVVCRGCRKSRKGNCAKCGSCPAETKMVQRQMGPGMIVQQQVQVPSKEKCKMEQTRLDVLIEKGMKDGSEIKFERMSEQKPVRTWRG